jgi:hypothetical protein
VSWVIGERALPQEGKDLVVCIPIRNRRELEVEYVVVREPVLHSAAPHLMATRYKSNNMREKNTIDIKNA